VFGGFLPSRPASARTAALERLLQAAGSVGLPLILYEAPHRIASLLSALATAQPDARIALGRELTKRHEEVLVGSPAEVAAALAQPRGEFTLVISEITSTPSTVGRDAPAVLAAGRSAGLPDRTLVELLRAIGVPRRQAYSMVSEPDTDSAKSPK
jgi:16S rRNA (cytidine1402-2'-O)-methyltransferase